MRLDIPVVQGSGDGSAHTLVRIGDTRVTRGSAAFEVTAPTAGGGGRTRGGRVEGGAGRDDIHAGVARAREPAPMKTRRAQSGETCVYCGQTARRNTINAAGLSSTYDAQIVGGLECGCRDGYPEVEVD